MDQTATIKIGKVPVGDSHPFVVIAEGCDNHRGSLELAKEMAHAAKEAGAPVIKFQLHLPDEEMDRAEIRKASSEMFRKWGDLYGFIKENLLSPEAHADLIAYCKKIGIQYFCTPFSAKAAKILAEIGGDEAFKIGSGETEDLPMIEEVAGMGKPMFVSTGMSTYDEIDTMVKTIKNFAIPFSLLHCISVYPPKTETDLHLGVIGELKKRYGVVVGFSDHTPPEGLTSTNGHKLQEEAIVFGAIAQGARYIEKHFTLDRSAPDADSRFSHDPRTLKKLVEVTAAIDKAMDRNRDVYESERGVWIWAKRSLFAREDIAKGAKIAREMIVSKRPGTGIRSKDYRSILGKIAKRKIQKGEMLKLSDLE